MNITFNMSCLLFLYTDFISRALQRYKSDSIINTPILIQGNDKCPNDRTNDCGPLVLYLINQFISTYAKLNLEERKNFTSSNYCKEVIADTTALTIRKYIKQEFERLASSCSMFNFL